MWTWDKGKLESGRSRCETRARESRVEMSEIIPCLKWQSKFDFVWHLLFFFGIIGCRERERPSDKMTKYDNYNLHKNIIFEMCHWDTQIPGTHRNTLTHLIHSKYHSMSLSLACLLIHYDFWTWFGDK